MAYISMHNHTCYSNLRLKDSINKVENLIDYAKELGHEGIAITDHEALSGHVKAIKHVKKMKEKGKLDDSFKLILGNEIYLVDRAEVSLKRATNERIPFYHLILLAKDKIGHLALRELSSIAWKDSFHFKGLERVPTYKDDFKKIVEKYKGHLICSTACLGGEFSQLTLKYINEPTIENKKKIHEFICTMKELFGNDFYIEIQPSYQEEQIKYNSMAIKIADGYNIKYIVTTDSHYLKKSHAIFHKCYLQSKDGDRETDDFYASTYMMDEEELNEYLKGYLTEEQIYKAINNTIDIKHKIEDYDLAKETTIPKAKIQPFKVKGLFSLYYSKYKYLELYANSEHEIDRYYLSLIEEGFLKKKQEFNDENISRINLEMEELWEISKNLKQQMSGYYVLTKDIIDDMWKADSLVGISRGSSSGYYTCYLLDIVQMNPIEHNLPHWRHLTKERIELPDIDIDSQSSKRQEIVDIMRAKYGDDNVINVCTFTTEKSKSSILTACRGLNIDHDIAQNIANLASYSSLTDCLYGNEEEGLKPLQELKNELKKHEGLEEAVLMFEGLVSGRSQHASGIFFLDDGIVSQNALMKTTSGKYITQFEYYDSTYMGCMKLDFLSISALERIRKCLDLLIKYNKIEEQPTLRETYNKYLHPDVLEFDNKEMFELLYEGHIIDAFQYDTIQGKKAIQKIQPHTFYELVAGNSLMRLACEGKQPIDRYVEHKKDISLWYNELKEHNLNDEEVKFLEKYLLSTYGVADTQESVMELSMGIGFTLAQANKLRKAIAKANAQELIKETQDLFYKVGIENNFRKELLNYIWDVQIRPMYGYAFSRNHTLPYSGILLQEMNLAYKYGPIWWKTACLSENIGDSGTVATAIGNMKGIVINPDINLSDIVFKPLEEEEKILFGLSSIDGISESISQVIIENRPYNSLDDVIVKLLEEGKISLLNLFKLAKAGCFNRLEANKEVKDILMEIVRKTTKLKDKLTIANANKILDKIPETLNFEKELLSFKKELKKSKEDKDNYYVSINKIDYVLSLGIEFEVENEVLKINVKAFDKFMKQYNENIKAWLNSEEGLSCYNRYLLNDAWRTYCLGNKYSWEMETISFYSKGHELDMYNLNDYYCINNFSELPKTPVLDETNKSKYKIYKLNTIAGTVLDKNKGKKIVYILTKDGVVGVKVSDYEFAKYDKKIVKINGKEKEILDDSWFKKGTLLVIRGYRREDDFVCKSYKRKNDKSIVKINGIRNGQILLQREKLKEEN